MNHADLAGAAEALMRHLRTASTPDRLRAAEALASFRSVEARDALRRAWADPSVKVRFAALTASVETGHPPTFEHALTLALKRAHLPYAARLLESMARRRPAEAADWLNRVSLAPPLA
ncbi:MAG: HEAT repeat domain-containing protein, partial [Hyphomonadaceae bacterium]